MESMELEVSSRRKSKILIVFFLVLGLLALVIVLSPFKVSLRVSKVNFAQSYVSMALNPSTGDLSTIVVNSLACDDFCTLSIFDPNGIFIQSVYFGDFPHTSLPRSLSDLGFSIPGPTDFGIYTLIAFRDGYDSSFDPVSKTELCQGNGTLLECLNSAPNEAVKSLGTFTISGEVIPAATINVVKTVINDNGGTKTFSDFPLFVSGTLVVSGVTNNFPATASYTVTETGNSGYTTVFSGDCDVNGNINLSPGDNKFCIVTNDDIAPPQVGSGGGGGAFFPSEPPLINVAKVPSPLALPAGPGPVTYTYTLSNIGTVPVSNVTMVGDTCSPIVLVSGDAFGDSILDVNEVWTYTCSITLTETHTNNIIATGWANGISAVDIASSTVVVGGIPGLPDTGLSDTGFVPPLINVTKIPNTLTLPIGGGLVTYTEQVTNLGMVPLSNIRLSDDKCGPTVYVSGDLNGDLKLDTNEKWTYTCSTILTTTTTNTVTASGDVNGLTQRDFAIAIVVVAVPNLPVTGLSSDSNFTNLAAIGLKEGDVISSPASGDPDVYIVNELGYKRLFLNPVIFNFYGHLGGFAAVKNVTPATRDMLITSGLFRNCETNDEKVYAVEVTGEDTGILHWVNVSGEQAVAEDANFFKKVFCINNNEFSWYTKSSALNSVLQVPIYNR